MGKTLRDKLPKVEIPEDRTTEAEEQQLLRERDAMHKLNQTKRVDDTKRSTEHGSIQEGDEVLLKQTRELKISWIQILSQYPTKLCRKTAIT